jgi:hypothetical protein
VCVRVSLNVPLPLSSSLAPIELVFMCFCLYLELCVWFVMWVRHILCYHLRTHKTKRSRRWFLNVEACKFRESPSRQNTGMTSSAMTGAVTTFFRGGRDGAPLIFLFSPALVEKITCLRHCPATPRRANGCSDSAECFTWNESKPVTGRPAASGDPTPLIPVPKADHSKTTQFSLRKVHPAQHHPARAVMICARNANTAITAIARNSHLSRGLVRLPAKRLRGPLWVVLPPCRRGHFIPDPFQRPRIAPSNHPESRCWRSRYAISPFGHCATALQRSRHGDMCLSAAARQSHATR